MSSLRVTDPTDLLQRLRRNPQVKAILRYGSGPVKGVYLGDLDLFVITYERPTGVESLHFRAGETPVDLNIRSVQDLVAASRPVSFIDEVMMHSKLLLDRDGDTMDLIREYCERTNLDSIAELTTAEVAFTRFSHRHLLDKVRNRLASDPLLCQFLLSTNIYWLVQTYFRIRKHPYPGEKAALRLLKTNDPDIWALVDSFYQDLDLERRFAINAKLTDLVLDPINGPWQPDEVLVLAAETDAECPQEDFTTKGKSFLNMLLKV